MRLFLAILVLVTLTGCQTVHVVDPGSREDVYYTNCRVCKMVMDAQGKKTFYCPAGVQGPADIMTFEELPVIPPIKDKEP